MLDLFTIFTKGGIVLWYFQGTALSLTPAVNALVKTVLLQERGGMNVFNHESLKLQFKLDNEFELVFVVVYQNILQLSYVDKLLDQVQLQFRDRYKNKLLTHSYSPSNYSNFGQSFTTLLNSLEEEQKLHSQQPKVMKKWQDSRKNEKLIQNGDVPKDKNTSNIKEDEDSQEPPSLEDKPNVENTGVMGNPLSSAKIRKIAMKKKTGPKKSVKTAPPTNGSVKRKKEDRTWVGVVNKDEAKSLNYSRDIVPMTTGEQEEKMDKSLKGSMIGELQPLQQYSSEEEEEEEDREEEEEPHDTKSSGGVFSFFKSLTAGRVITRESMSPVMEKMKEHLITKNVAAEISDKLCESVVTKLNGKTIGTFRGIQSVIRGSMEESLVQILSPKHRIDILHKAKQAEVEGRPYVVTFCGVNGVGKSTNLAKVCFWLLENDLRVLIAGCDTFRSGAVEQLKTHTRRLSALHPPDREGGPPRVMLFEQGYGKDAAGICMAAINYARQQRFNVVLVDTAGRMQDNEPLMKSLAKLILVNTPDIVLFVGEALVGNEAVDQLVKFNRALIDHADTGKQDPRSIDGIVLTKFDTIDDKVGAAISMTYTTGQPIVFIGTGQTYKDLRTLNVQAVVSALLK